MANRLAAEFVGTAWLVFGGSAGPCWPQPSLMRRMRQQAESTALPVIELPLERCPAAVSRRGWAQASRGQASANSPGSASLH
jgi:hypothetical protein